MAEADLVFLPLGGQGTVAVEHVRDAVRARGLGCHLRRYDDAPEIPWLVFEKEFVALRFSAVGNAGTKAILEVVLDDASLAAGLMETLETIEEVFSMLGWEAGTGRDS